MRVMVLVLMGVVALWSQARGVVGVEAGANLPTQQIGPRDLIAVSVYDAPELTRTIRVGADGWIRVPMLKQRLRAEGLLPAELEASLAAALVTEQVLVDPVVTVTIAEYHSRPISVAGAVKNPVTFQAEGPVTLLDALTRAGGLSPDAGPEILVSRMQAGPDGATTPAVKRILVKGLIDAADPELNLKLAGGEEIRVPEAGRIYVVGNVRKPGSFAIQETAETSVMKALALAEGLAPFASQQAYTYRRDPASGSRQEVSVELKKILQRKAPDVALVASDILYIPDNTRRRITADAVEKIAGFGASTASGVLIWRR